MGGQICAARLSKIVQIVMTCQGLNQKLKNKWELILLGWRLINLNYILVFQNLILITKWLGASEYTAAVESRPGGVPPLGGTARREQ